MVYRTKPKNLFNVNLTDEQVKQLEELASYRKKFKSDVLREALRVAYEEMQEEVKNEEGNTSIV